MTEQDWAEAARTSGTMEVYQLTLLAWADWVEERGYPYSHGLRWLSREGLFPCSSLSAMLQVVEFLWYNQALYQGPAFRGQEWFLPENVYRNTSAWKDIDREYPVREEDESRWKSYDNLFTAIHAAALSYEVTCYRPSTSGTSRPTGISS